MLLRIPNVLTEAQLTQVHELLKGQEFQDGRATAGWAAKLVKNNQQLAPSAPHLMPLQHMLVQALSTHAIFSMAAMAKAYRPITFSRYEVGMSYGDHVDNALMGDEPQIRSDLSFTLFLNEPGEYDGGSLIVDDAYDIKLPAGAAVLYPSGSLHRVQPVTRGTRLVAVGWLQSLIRRTDQREILFELEALRRQIFLKDGKTPAFDTLSKNVANLWRMWAEP